MREFTRQPTREERGFVIVLSGVLAIVLGALSLFLAWKEFWGASTLPGALCAGMLAILYRAAFGTRRALSRKESDRLAWVLLLLGSGGFALAAFAHDGAKVHRMMLTGGSITFFSAGLAGIRERRGRR